MLQTAERSVPSRLASKQTPGVPSARHRSASDLPDPNSVAVIGAGPGGLASAVLLAAKGVKVTVYEAAPSVGGRTGRIQVGPYGFDRGPTFFLMPYVLEEIFASAGRRLSDYATLCRLDPMYRLLLGRQEPGQHDAPPITIDATQNVTEMARRLSAINLADGPAFERFIADNRTKLRLMEPILRSSITSPIDLVSLGAIKFLPHLNAHLAVAGLLKKYFTSPYSRLAVSFQSKYLGMSPTDCPSLFTILPFIEYEYGVWHPVGGCNALMHALADLLIDLGGQIHTSARVQSLCFEGRRVTGVKLSGDPAPKRHAQVLINADATAAIKALIPPDLRPRNSSDQQLDNKRYSCSTHMLYLGVEGDVNLPHHTIFVSGKYQQNLDDITTGGTLSDDPSIYLCNPSPIDPSLAPHGHSSLYALMPTPNCQASEGKVDWTNQAPAIREVMLTQLERRLGLTDLKRRIRAEHAITPHDWQRGADSTGPINHGATFNLAHNLGQMLHKRVPHKLPSLDNLYFCGGGTHPGSGLPVIFLSAQIVTKQLCKDRGVSTDDAALSSTR
jgi:phytoene desaturase